MYQNFRLRSCFALVTLLLFCSPRVQAQKALNVDSMKQLLKSSTGVEKYKLTYQIGYELFDVDNVEALKYASEAHALSKQLGDSLEITRSGRVMGQLLRRLDRLDDAIMKFQEMLPIAERNGYVEEQKRILNALAVGYNYKAMYDLALHYNFRSLEIREREGKKEEIADALNNVGMVYYKIGNFDLALNFYQRSLQTRIDAEDDKRLDQLYINISLCHNYLGDSEEAKKYAYKGFAACGDNCSNQIKIEGEFCLGQAFSAERNFEEARIHFTKSYDLAKELDDKRFQAESSFGIGSTYLEEGDIDQALPYLISAERFAKPAGYNQILIHTYLRISRAYNELKDFENAALYQGKYIQLKDSVYSEELIKNLARVQTDYEERENIKTIAEKNENLRLKEEVIVRQRQIYFFIVALAVLSLGLAFVFFIYNRAISKAKAEVTMLNQTLELKVQDRTKALQSVNNELDNFIYKTSHDIRGPLASLKGIANVALLELEDPKAKDYLRKLDNSADKLNSILTRLLIVNQINHAVLSPQKIDFEELINEILVFERKKGIPATMKIDHEVDANVELITDRHLLRIIVENLVDNAIKYHNNSERVEPFVKIKITQGGEYVTIKVIDNGIGIQERDPQKLFQMFVRASERSESGGIGLYLTKLASERLEAKVDFATTADKFTQFSVQLPANLKKVLEAKDFVPRVS